MNRDHHERPFTPYNDCPNIVQQEMPKAYDFLPRLSFQQKYHPLAPCYMMYGDVNKQIKDATWGARETVIPIGGVAEQAPTDTQKTRVRIGTVNPWEAASDGFGQSTLDSIAESTFRVLNISDLNIIQLGLLYAIPKHLRDHEVFEDASVIAHELTRRGNRSTQFKKMTGIDTFDSYNAMSDALEQRGHGEDAITDMRGHNATMGLCADNGSTHVEMAKHGILRDVLTATHYSDFDGNGGDFMRSIGNPDKLSNKYGGRIYELDHGEDNIMPG